MPRISNARTAMVGAATRLLAERGATAAGLQDIVAVAGAPRGSIYHHFPEGKDELLSAAVDTTGSAVAAAVTAACAEAADPADAVARVARLFRAGPEASGWTMGCPVAAAATGGDHQGARVRDAVGRAFGAWVDTLAAGLAARGMPADRAAPFAAAVVAALEGALLLSRGTRSSDGYDAVTAMLVAAAR